MQTHRSRHFGCPATRTPPHALDGDRVQLRLSSRTPGSGIRFPLQWILIGVVLCGVPDLALAQHSPRAPYPPDALRVSAEIAKEGIVVASNEASSYADSLAALVRSHVPVGTKQVGPLGCGIQVVSEWVRGSPESGADHPESTYHDNQRPRLRLSVQYTAN